MLRVDLPQRSQIGNPPGVVYDGSSLTPAEGASLISVLSGIMISSSRVLFSARVVSHRLGFPHLAARLA
jgi:hypothetical protein